MTRYPTALPDFCRTVWVSDAARDHWAPPIAAIGALRRRLERETVYRGQRGAAILDVAPADLAAEIVEAAARDCVAFPLDVTANVGYAAVARAPAPGEAARLRVALCDRPTAAPFRAAWSAQDDDAIGAQLGFPACCRASFRAVWVGARRIDPTWPQAAQGDDADETIDLATFAPEANVLGRWLGIRQVAHLPCAFTCAATVDVAHAWRGVADALGEGARWAELAAMTRWPIEWSALHGIGQIVSPVWKVIARTDATAERLTIRLHGDVMPAEAARGLVFPYARIPRFTEPVTPDLWTSNGFSTRDGMARAHQTIVEAVHRWRPVPGAVLDLGCGSGELVRRLASHRRGGVEIDPARLAPAIARDPAGAYVAGDLRDPAAWPPGPWDLTLCMIGRLLEGEAAAARAALGRGPVVFYAYPDWLAGRPFDAMLRAAGVADRRELARAVSAEAVAIVVE